MTPLHTQTRLTYSVTEAAHVAGVSRELLYKLIRRNELRTVQIGTKLMIPAPELHRLTGTNTEQS